MIEHVFELVFGGAGAKRIHTDPRLVLVVAGALAAGVFAGCALFAWRDFRSNLVYESAPATVTRSEVVRSGSDGAVEYRAVVRFAYVVADRTYESDTYEFERPSAADRAAQDAVVAAYPVGSKHTAWYDPADPSVAVLTRKIHWLVPTIGIGLSFLFGRVALKALGEAREQRRAAARAVTRGASPVDGHSASDDFNAPR